MTKLDFQQIGTSPGSPFRKWDFKHGIWTVDCFSFFDNVHLVHVFHLSDRLEIICASSGLSLVL